MKTGLIPRDAVRRVLVRLPNWLGDTVMALPLLRSLRRAVPEAELWCLGPWATTILESEPGITRRLLPRGASAPGSPRPGASGKRASTSP